MQGVERCLCTGAKKGDTLPTPNQFSFVSELDALLQEIVNIAEENRPIELRFHEEKSKAPDPTRPHLLEIIGFIAKRRSICSPATPEDIAKELNIDTAVMLAYMDRYHNEQWISFESPDGKPPTANSNFLLSPKAVELISVKAK